MLAEWASYKNALDNLLAVSVNVEWHPRLKNISAAMVEGCDYQSITRTKGLDPPPASVADMELAMYSDSED